MTTCEVHSYQYINNQMGLNFAPNQLSYYLSTVILAGSAILK